LVFSKVSYAIPFCLDISGYKVSNSEINSITLYLSSSNKSLSSRNIFLVLISLNLESYTSHLRNSEMSSHTFNPRSSKPVKKSIAVIPYFVSGLGLISYIIILIPE